MQQKEKERDSFSVKNRDCTFFFSSNTVRFPPPVIRFSFQLSAVLWRCFFLEQSRLPDDQTTIINDGSGCSCCCCGTAQPANHPPPFPYPSLCSLFHRSTSSPTACVCLCQLPNGTAQDHMSESERVHTHTQTSPGRCSVVIASESCLECFFCWNLELDQIIEIAHTEASPLFSF